MGADPAALNGHRTTNNPPTSQPAATQVTQRLRALHEQYKNIIADKLSNAKGYDKKDRNEHATSAKLLLCTDLPRQCMQQPAEVQGTADVLSNGSSVLEKIRLFSYIIQGGKYTLLAEEDSEDMD